ncbi:MAG: hypothetical protein ACOYNI_12505 [Acidimicrobiia bacterium]
MERDLFAAAMERLVGELATSVSEPYESYDFDLIIDSYALLNDDVAWNAALGEVPDPSPRLWILAYDDQHADRLQGFMPRNGNAIPYDAWLSMRESSVFGGRPSVAIVGSGEPGEAVLQLEQRRALVSLESAELSASVVGPERAAKYVRDAMSMRVMVGDESAAANVELAPETLAAFITRLRVPPRVRSIAGRSFDVREGPSLGM